MGSLLQNQCSNIQYIYNENYLYKNLYRVEVVEDNTTNNEIYKYFQLNAIDVSFDSPTLTLERNIITKKFKVTSSETYKYPSTLSITWRENNNWDVRRFHQDWLNNIFNADKDAFKSYESSSDAAKKVYKNFKVIFPEGNNSNYVLYLNNVILSNPTSALSFSWGSTGGIVTQKISYYVESWSLEEDTGV